MSPQLPSSSLDGLTSSTLSSEIQATVKKIRELERSGRDASSECEILRVLMRSEYATRQALQGLLNSQSLESGIQRLASKNIHAR